MHNIHTTEEYTTVQEIVDFTELIKILMTQSWLIQTIGACHCELGKIGSDTLSQLFVNCFWLEKSLLIQVELRKPFTDGRNIKLDVIAHYANTY